MVIFSRDQKAMELVDVGARARPEREMMQSDPIAIELGAPIGVRGGANRNRHLRVGPMYIIFVFILSKPEFAEHFVIEGARARDVIHGEIDMFDA